MLYPIRVSAGGVELAHWPPEGADLQGEQHTGFIPGHRLWAWMRNTTQVGPERGFRGLEVKVVVRAGFNVTALPHTQIC